MVNLAKVGVVFPSDGDARAGGTDGSRRRSSEDGGEVDGDASFEDGRFRLESQASRDGRWI